MAHTRALLALVEELDERHHHEEEPNAGTRAVLFGFAEKKFWLPSLCGQNGHPRTNLTLGLSRLPLHMHLLQLTRVTLLRLPRVKSIGIRHSYMI